MLVYLRYRSHRSNLEFHVKMKGEVNSKKDYLSKTIEYPDVTIDATAESVEEGLYATK